jgi:hypothetical protein
VITFCISRYLESDHNPFPDLKKKKNSAEKPIWSLGHSRFSGLWVFISLSHIDEISNEQGRLASISVI